MLTDVRMPDMSGLELQSELKARRNSLGVVVISGHGDIAMAVQAMRAGAVDFIEKSGRHRQQVLAATHAALARDARFRLAHTRRVKIRDRLETLSPRQREVLDWLIAGKEIKEIAATLGTSHHTVRNQRTAILKKMQANSFVELIDMVRCARCDADHADSENDYG